MEVNEIKGDLREAAAPDSALVNDTTSNSASGSPQASDTTRDPVTVDLTIRDLTAGVNETRNSINTLISIVNVASEATTQMHKIVQSLTGILDQVEQGNLPSHHQEALGHEANQLVQELQSLLNVDTPSGTHPLAGDKVRVEVEEKWGKALELFFPDHSQDSFGLGNMNLTTRESILRVKTNVEAARRQIEDLHATVERSRVEVQTFADRVDVADQNSEASHVSVRDLDAALALAGKTQRSIGASPKTAVQSFGGLHEVVQDLLK